MHDRHILFESLPFGKGIVIEVSCVLYIISLHTLLKGSGVLWRRNRLWLMCIIWLISTYRIIMIASWRVSRRFLNPPHWCFLFRFIMWYIGSWNVISHFPSQNNLVYIIKRNIFSIIRNKSLSEILVLIRILLLRLIGVSLTIGFRNMSKVMISRSPSVALLSLISILAINSAIRDSSIRSFLLHHSHFEEFKVFSCCF